MLSISSATETICVLLFTGLRLFSVFNIIN